MVQPDACWAPRTGVERFADAEIVANYIVAGQTGVVPVDDEDDGPSDEDITVSEGGILLL